MEILKDAYIQIADSIIEILPGCDKYMKVILEIERQKDSVGYSGFYFDINGQKKWLNFDNFRLDEQNIHRIHTFITRMGNQENGWTRAIFRMFSKERIEMDYIWD